MIHTIEVIGRPAPWQQKGGYYGGAGAKRCNAPESKYAVPWRNAVIAACREQYKGDPIPGKVRFSVVYRMPRPKKHYRTGRHEGKLKPSAPRGDYDNKPDLDNLDKGTKDGITIAGVWADDRKVTRTGERIKRWIEPGELPGATITVEEIE